MINKMEAVVYTAPNEMTFYSEYKPTQIDVMMMFYCALSPLEFVGLICTPIMAKTQEETLA